MYDVLFFSPPTSRSSLLFAPPSFFFRWNRAVGVSGRLAAKTVCATCLFAPCGADTSFLSRDDGHISVTFSADGVRRSLLSRKLFLFLMDLPLFLRERRSRPVAFFLGGPFLVFLRFGVFRGVFSAPLPQTTLKLWPPFTFAISASTLPTGHLDFRF